MKFLKGLVIVLLVLFAGYCIWMATLPSSYNVERTATIDAPPAQVYAVVNNFETWENWDPWSTMDSTNVITMGESSEGMGASYSWKGDVTGQGTQEITSVTENESISTHIVFVGMGESDSKWIFESAEGGEKTNVTWTLSGDVGFFGRIQTVFMDGAVGPQYEQGLENLNEYIKTMPAPKPEMPAFEMVETTAMAYYSVTDDIAISEMAANGAEFMGARYGELSAFLGDDMKNMTSPPFALYHKWDEENDMATVEVAMAVTSDKEGNDRVKKGMTYAGTALKATHMGPYEATGEVHMAMNKYIAENGHEMTGSCWEVYVTDPGNEPDPAKWITEIYYPVAPKAEDAGEA